MGTRRNPTWADFEQAHTYRQVPFERARTHLSTIPSYLRRHADAQPDAAFVTAVADDGTAVSLTYQGAEVLSQRFAAWARRNEIAPGDVVGLLPANNITSVIAVLGLLRTGCAILMLNPSEPLARLRSQADNLRAKIVLRVAAVASNASTPVAIDVPEVGSLNDDVERVPDVALDPSTDALFFPTSGSTAVSKLVAQSHRNAVVNAEAVSRHHRLSTDDRLLGCLPICHVNGLHFTVFASLVAGAHAILAEGFDPFSYPNLIERFRPRIASVVPSILEALLASWRGPALSSDLEYFVSAAAPLPVRTARIAAERMKVRVLQGYGLTETTNFSTTMPAAITWSDFRRLTLDSEIPPVGIALEGNEVAVLTPDGERVVPGAVGEICMRGHNVMTRYAGNPDATTDAFRHGWFHSQDLGFELKDERTNWRFVVLVGRMKNIAKVRGEAVSLDEMDRVLRAMPQIGDAACVSLPHRFLGDEVVAVIVPLKDISDDDIRAHLLEAFAPTVLPRRVVRIGGIPRTATGKVLRARLAEQIAPSQ